MKLLSIFAFLVVLATTVLAWEKEDYEIFDLVSAVETSEGKGTTFYSWLDVPSTATTSEIAKAYRKMSMQLHPDKNPDVKGVHERFSRLGVVSTILRNKESRARYDFFYKNGVPKWRGTGYYYARFRPGLGSVSVFLVVFTSSLQFIVQRMNYRRDLERIERFTGEARLAAWGPKLILVDGQRKVKVNLGGPRNIDDDGNVTSGKWIDMVVEGQDVFILDPSGDLHPLNASAANKPIVSNTWFLALVRSLFQKVTSSIRGKRSGESSLASATDSEFDERDDSSMGASDSPGSGTVTPKDEGKGGRIPTVKAGGRRRKTVRRK